MNITWHSKNVLGQNAPLAKRIDWHLAHKKHCTCRDMPESIKAALKGKKIKTCTRGHHFIDVGSCPMCWPGARKR